MAVESDRKLLRLPQVQELYPVCRATIYNMINRGKFPKPIRIGRNSFWRQKDVEDFIASA